MIWGVLIACIFGLAVYVILIIDCRITAKQLNRDQDGWTLAAIFLPVISLFILGVLLKPKPPKRTEMEN
jgi:hypothetical protein